MRRLLKIILLLLIGVGTPRADGVAELDLDTLLNLYKREADLSNQTKRESAGNLIIYTRSELERMQLRYLYELIKRLPFLNYLENQRGYANPFHDGYQPADSAGIRIFINDYEVASPFYGNSLALISHLDLSFIDHIEFYQSYPSLELSIEPAAAVLKLYTKQPEREQGGRIALDLSNLGSHNAALSQAGHVAGINYYSHLSNNAIDRSGYQGPNGEPLSKSQRNNNLYFSADKAEHRVELQLLQTRHDDLTGFSSDMVPDLAISGSDFYHLGWRSQLADNLTLKLGYSNLRSFIDAEEQHYLIVPPYLPKQYAERSDESILTAELRKQVQFNHHQLLMGLQYRETRFDFLQQYYGDTLLPPGSLIDPLPWHIDLKGNPYNRDQNSSLYLEENLRLGNHHRLIASGKYSEIKRNGGFRSDTLSSYRAGYIFRKPSYGAKLFYIDADMPLDPGLLSSPLLGNRELNNERFTGTTLELSYQREALQANLLFYQLHNRDTVIFDLDIHDLRYTNIDTPLKTSGVSINLSYRLSALNRIELMAYQRRDDIPAYRRIDRYHGGHLRFIGTLGRWDLFAEGLWRDARTEDSWNTLSVLGGNSSVDLNTAVSYHVSRDLAFTLKGQNLLDDTTSNPLHTIGISRSQIDVNRLDAVDSSERQYWLSLEYLF